MNCASKIVDACGGPDDAIPHVQAILDELVAAERERIIDVVERELDSNGQAQAIVLAIRGDA